jgi:hypothetical protein
MAQHEFEVRLEFPDGRAMVDTARGETAAEVRRAYEHKWKDAKIVSVRLVRGSEGAAGDGQNR